MYVRLTYPKIQAFDSNGDFAVLYEIHTYHAGLATAMTTYSDRLLTVPNANPVVLNSRGEADIYIGEAAKLVFTAPGGDPTSPIWTVDYVGEQQSTFVTGSATPVTANNNYVVDTIPPVSALSNNFMLIMTPDVDNADTLVSNVFTGTGSNDCVESGAYVGSTAGSVFTIQIDGALQAAPIATTIANSAVAGAVTAGNHIVKLTAVTLIGETVLGTASNTLNAAGAKQIDVSGIPAIAGQVTGYNVYMTKAAGAVYYLVNLAPITTTTYVIDIADATLGTGGYVIAPTEDTTGSGDTFKWKKDGGAWTEGVAITAVAQNIYEGLIVTFAITTGHVLDDLWAITVETPARVNLDGLGNLLVYKNRGGSIVALDGSDMKAGYPAQLILNEALNAWLLINPATPTFDVPTILAVRYRKNISAEYDLTIDDQGFELSCVGTFDLNLTTCAEFASRFVYIKNSGTGIITVVADGSEVIYGLGKSTFLIGLGECYQFQTNGVDWHILSSLGGEILIGRQDVVAAASTTFNNLQVGTKYKLLFDVVNSNNGVNIIINFNADTGNNYAGSIIKTSDASTVNAFTNCIPACITAAVTTNSQCRVEFMTFHADNHKVWAMGSSNFLGAAYYIGVMGGVYNGAADLTSVTVSVGAGTITGRFLLYKVV